MSASAEPSAKGSVLVIDDDELLREAIGHLLEQSGFSVETCGDALEGLLCLRRRVPDVIVLDLRLPIMNGWEFRLAQKDAPRWADIPVVAISADRSAQAAAIDADAFLPKPVSHAALRDTVKRLWLLAERRKHAEQQAELERLRGVGQAAGAIAEQASKSLPTLLENLRLAQQKARELEMRVSRADAFSLLGIRQLLAGVERGTENLHTVLQNASTFADRAAQAATRRPRVLVVHSDAQMGLTISRILRGEGEVVVATLDGQTSKTVLDQDDFDIVLLDFSLLGEWGIAAYERLVHRKPEQARRIVFLTTGGLDERELAFFAQHRPTQLRSPFTATDLFELMDAPWRSLH